MVLLKPLLCWKLGKCPYHGSLIFGTMRGLLRAGYFYSPHALLRLQGRPGRPSNNLSQVHHFLRLPMFDSTLYTSLLSERDW